MIRIIDELNNITPRVIPAEEYFADMDLDEEQIEKRIEYTKKANEIFDLILVLLLTMREDGYYEYDYVFDSLQARLTVLINEYSVLDTYLIEYISELSDTFIEVTKNHIDEAWYLSEERSLFNAENSANDVFNYNEYKDAIRSGKKRKTWITERDKRVRDTHREVDGKEIPIMDFFTVGGVKMRFPKDMEYAFDVPRETVNCRCTIKYF